MNELQQFLAMGGYGGYVWGAYGLVSLLLVGHLIAVIGHGRTARRIAGRSTTTEE